jgi:hypothetical protein
MTVGLSSLNEIMEQRITFFFLSPPDNKKMLPHEYLRYLNKNDNFTTARNAQGTKYMKSFITPTTKGAAPYIKVAMVSDELKKIVFLTKGPKISEEEFYVVVDSFKCEEGLEDIVMLKQNVFFFLSFPRRRESRFLSGYKTEPGPPPASPPKADLPPA